MQQVVEYTTSIGHFHQGLLVVIHKGYRVSRSCLDNGTIENIPEVIPGAQFTRLMQVRMEWHVEEGRL